MIWGKLFLFLDVCLQMEYENIFIGSKKDLDFREKEIFDILNNRMIFLKGQLFFCFGDS